MDFSAHPGTDVYATGDGTVVKMDGETGYGNTVEIDHGFGISYPLRPFTRSFVLNWDKKVVRGEVIAGVGSTGKSTGSAFALRSARQRTGGQSGELLLYGFECGRL